MVWKTGQGVGILETSNLKADFPSWPDDLQQLKRAVRGTPAKDRPQSHKWLVISANSG
jgi:hypothetical protein